MIEILKKGAESTPPMNLLVNGDFQINQRGQTTYYANGTSWLYTFDMWRINNHSKLYVNDGYIRFHKVDTDQQALLNQVAKTKDKSITVIKVKAINGTATVRFGDPTVVKTITQNGIFTIKNGVPISSVAIDLVTNGHYIDIEYIDIFEGDIAYPHVKEDYALASIRCQEYLLVSTLNHGLANAFYGGLMLHIPMSVKLAGQPKISFSGDVKAIIHGVDSKQVTAMSVGYFGNKILAINMILNSSVDNGTVYEITDGTIIASCEPEQPLKGFKFKYQKESLCLIYFIIRKVSLP